MTTTDLSERIRRVLELAENRKAIDYRPGLNSVGSNLMLDREISVLAPSIIRDLLAANRGLAAPLQKAVDDYGKPGGPWNVPSEPGTWIEMARQALSQYAVDFGEMTLNDANSESIDALKQEVDDA